MAKFVKGVVAVLSVSLITCWAPTIALARADNAANFPLAQPQERQRAIILTDIEADPDDTQSLVRLLLYANEIDIKAIVATTSVWKKTDIKPESILATIEKYGAVQSRLSQHAVGYPSAKQLRQLVLSGQPDYGMASVGAGKDTEGSAAIIRELEKSDDRPLWISVWGGANTLAQALYTLRESHGLPELEKLVAKLRVYTISDQDDSGQWLRKEFPNLFYIVSPGTYDKATWTAITRSGASFDVFATNDWLAENIQQDHGPLGAHYPDTVWGMEGDTPAFLSLIPNGVNEPNHPDWGGWGGRYELYQPTAEAIGVGVGNTVNGGIPLEPETRPIWTNASDSYQHWDAQKDGRAIGPVGDPIESRGATILRWKNDFQNDFAARMDWTITSPSAANHAPNVKLAHSNELTAKSGEGISLSAFGSNDPDGDSLSYHWFNYAEAGTLGEPIDMGHAVNDIDVYFQLPDVQTPEIAHFIVRVTDKGEPPLSRYERVIVTITP